MPKRFGIWLYLASEAFKGRTVGSVYDFFTRLLDTSSWPARWYCGGWSQFHGWLYIISDLVIWLSYFVLPVIILYFIQKRPDIHFPPVFWLFAAFILLCGTTHFLDAIIFWWPAYRLSALLRFATAIVSLITVVVLIYELPKILKFIPVLNSTEDSKESLKAALIEREQEIVALRQKLGVRSDGNKNTKH